MEIGCLDKVSPKTTQLTRSATIVEDYAKPMDGGKVYLYTN
jgi:hypothetical protein